MPGPIRRSRHVAEGINAALQPMGRGVWVRIAFATLTGPPGLHDQMKQGRALEHLQELLSPLRLSYPLTLKVEGCDGAINAWYNDEVVTVCYELLADILKSAPAHDLPIGVTGRTPSSVLRSTYLHETGHAVFNMLQIPVLGREEDAADQFAATLAAMARTGL